MGWNHFCKICLISLNLEIPVISLVISYKITAKQTSSIKQLFQQIMKKSSEAVVQELKK